MQQFPRCWDRMTRISYLQRKIIISSILYYEFNESPISDKEYDELSKQLVELQQGGAEKSQYWYCFYDFDGSTGFDLRDRLNEHDKKYLTHLSYLFSKRKVVILNKREHSKKGRLI